LVVVLVTLVSTFLEVSAFLELALLTDFDVVVFLAGFLVGAFLAVAMNDVSPH
jgi:hypothetical protein